MAKKKNFEETDEISILSKNPLSILISLPNGCDPGKFEAAEAFVASIKKIKEVCPEKIFQFIPFEYSVCIGNSDIQSGTSGLNSLLAVEV